MVVLGDNTNPEHSPEFATVALTAEARKLGTYVIGTTGTGKTTLLLNMIVQDMQYRGPFGYEGLCVLDPHGDFTTEILKRVPAERVQDVILLDPNDSFYPFGLNLFDCNKADPRERDRVAENFIQALRRLFADSWGPRMEDLLRHAVLSLLLHPEATSLLDLMLVLTNMEHRQRLTAPAKKVDPVLRAYWEDEFPESVVQRDGRVHKPHQQVELVSSSLNKIGRFLTNPITRRIVSQPHSTVNFRQAMDEGRIVLVNLSKGDIGGDNAFLLGAVIVNQILLAALSRRDTPEEARRPFHLYADEYQTFATSTFPELQSEARKYAVDTVVAHQYRDQLDDDNKGSTLNVANLIVLRVSGLDAPDLAAQFDNTPPAGDVRYEPIYQEVNPNSGMVSRAQTMGSGSGLFRMGEQPRQLYSDVHAETANLLTQTPSHHAFVRLVGLGDDPTMLRQFRIKLSRKPVTERIDPTPHIHQQSRALIRMTADEVDAYVRQRTKGALDRGGSYDEIEPEERLY